MYDFNHGFLHPHQLTREGGLIFSSLPIGEDWTTDLYSGKCSKIQPKKLSFLCWISVFRSWCSLNRWLEETKLFKTMNKNSS